MKINVEIDCTPEEARKFLGLPDVAAMQDSLMKQVESQMASALKGMDPDTMLKSWLPAGMEGMEQMQKAFWAQNAFCICSIPSMPAGSQLFSIVSGSIPFSAEAI